MCSGHGCEVAPGTLISAPCLRPCTPLRRGGGARAGGLPNPTPTPPPPPPPPPAGTVRRPGVPPSCAVPSSDADVVADPHAEGVAPGGVRARLRAARGPHAAVRGAVSGASPLCQGRGRLGGQGGCGAWDCGWSMPSPYPPPPPPPHHHIQSHEAGPFHHLYSLCQTRLILKTHTVSETENRTSCLTTLVRQSQSVAVSQTSAIGVVRGGGGSPPPPIIGPR